MLGIILELVPVPGLLKRSCIVSLFFRVIALSLGLVRLSRRHFCLRPLHAALIPATTAKKFVITKKSGTIE
jgi:hypothetical protein